MNDPMNTDTSPPSPQIDAALRCLGEFVVRRGSCTLTGARALAAARDLKSHGEGGVANARMFLRSIIAEEARASAAALEVAGIAAAALDALGAGG